MEYLFFGFGILYFIFAASIIISIWLIQTLITLCLPLYLGIKEKLGNLGNNEIE